MPPPKLELPLPPLVELFEIVPLVMVRVPALIIPPPWLVPPEVTFPLAIVRSDIATVLPDWILTTRLTLFPLIVSTLAPGPLIVRFLSISSSPLVRVIVAGPPAVRPEAKVIVSPGQAVLIASRKLPAPVSLVLVTTSSAPQVTVIVAVAAELRPAPPELVAPCTWKLKVLDGLVRLCAGVNFSPASPSANVMD